MPDSLLYLPEIFGLSIEVYLILLIIAIPTFLFWRWLLKRYIKVPRTRKLATRAATLVLTPIIYGGLIVLLIWYITYTPTRDFNKSKWLTDKQERFQMADDIIESKMLIGKDTIQVKQILGDPGLGGDSTHKWIYDMGMGGGGLGFLFHNLNIILDNKGKVILVEHIEIPD